MIKNHLHTEQLEQLLPRGTSRGYSVCNIMKIFI